MKCNKIIHKVSIILSVLIVLIAAYPGRAAAKDGDKSKAWAEPYKKIVKRLEKENKGSESKLTYDLIYFNDDKIPELVAGHTGYWVSMYTYEDGKVYTVIDHWPYGAMGNVGYEYIPKKNVLRNYNNDFAGASQYTYFGKMKRHKLVDYYSKELRRDMFIDKNKNGIPEEDEFLEDKFVYYYGNKKISEEKFNKYLIGGEYEEICGTLSKKKILKKLK